MNSDLARLNFKFVEKSIWIAAFGFCVLSGLILNYGNDDVAIGVGCIFGLTMGVVSLFLWKNDYEFLNVIIANTLFVPPAVFFANSSDNMSVVFQFFASALLILGCYFFIFKTKLIKYLSD